MSDEKDVGVRLTDDECLRIVRASIATDRVLSGQGGTDGHPPDVLLTTVREIINEHRAQALRDAADDWQQGAWTVLTAKVKAGSVLGAGQAVTDWLRARVTSPTESPTASTVEGER